VIALPGQPGLVGGVLLAFGVVLAVTTAVVGRRSVRPALAGPGAGPAAAIVALALAVALGAAPYLAWRVVQDVRYTSALDAPTAARIVPIENGIDSAALDVVEAAIPRGASFYVRDAVADQVFANYVRATLLPRIAVDDPKRAGWLVTRGVDPETLGPALVQVQELPPPPGSSAPKIFVAKVAS
jgi:hypothetical protein